MNERILAQDAVGAYRAVINNCSEAVRVAAWAEAAETLELFETHDGIHRAAEGLMAAGVKPA